MPIAVSSQLQVEHADLGGLELVIGDTTRSASLVASSSELADLRVYNGTANLAQVSAVDVRLDEGFGTSLKAVDLYCETMDLSSDPDVEQKVEMSGVHVTDNIVAAGDFLHFSIDGLTVGYGTNGPSVPARILLSGISGFTVKGAIHKAQQHGVRLVNCQLGVADLNIVSPSIQTDNAFDGFHLEGCDKVQVRGAVRGAEGVSQNPRYGVWADAACTDIDVDVDATGCQSGAFQNLAAVGQFTTRALISTEDPSNGQVPVWDEAQGIFRPGSPGVSPSAIAYAHVQGASSALWTINHPLSFQPNVAVVDSGGEQVEGDVTYVDSDTITLEFSAAFSGVAYLS